MVGRAERRRAHELRALEPRPRHVVLAQVQVLGARLGVRRLAAVARLPQRVQRVTGRQVHDVGGSPGELGEANDAMHRLALHDRGPREPVVHRSGLPLVQVLPHQHVDRAAVLRVHHDERARLPGLAHGTEDRRVVQHEHAGVGHEELERRDALPDQLVHLLRTWSLTSRMIMWKP